MLQESVNAIVQLAVVLVIGLVFWLLFGRKHAGFFRWIGLVAPTAGSMRTAFIVFLAWSALTTLVYFWPPMSSVASAENTIAGMLRAEGFSAEIVGVILIVAGIKTAFTEEIFFRGLIAKRLINAFGFWAGNTVQALLFGAIHLLIFAIPGGPVFTLELGAAVLLLPGGAGFLMGYLNERVGNGSIAPGWLIHAFGNAVSYPILAFIV